MSSKDVQPAIEMNENVKDVFCGDPGLSRVALNAAGKKPSPQDNDELNFTINIYKHWRIRIYKPLIPLKLVLFFWFGGGSFCTTISNGLFQAKRNHIIRIVNIFHPLSYLSVLRHSSLRNSSGQTGEIETSPCCQHDIRNTVSQWDSIHSETERSKLRLATHQSQVPSLPVRQTHHQNELRRRGGHNRGQLLQCAVS
ncbi:MFS_1_like domain-containing protein [Caerostris extrusa]|uniref:MFS_1_like domain-containing protein n=1 Tax=Caerostris extrusa TaxID=172846 RepID=A0AAV4SSK9_CAEEX|nr:MFS_1_like domain-containing protein [Caerostris extrusa]